MDATIELLCAPKGKTVKYRNGLSYPLQFWIAPVFDIACWAIAILFATYLRYDVVSSIKLRLSDVYIGIGISAALQILLGSIFYLSTPMANRVLRRSRYRIGSRCLSRSSTSFLFASGTPFRTFFWRGHRRDPLRIGPCRKRSSDISTRHRGKGHSTKTPFRRTRHHLWSRHRWHSNH